MQTAFSLFLIYHILKLTIIQVSVEAAGLDQLVVGALLHNVAVTHHEDEVGVLDGRKAVGDDEAGAALHQTVHCGLDLLLGTGIDTAGRLVEDQDAVVRQNGTGDRQQLLLALTDVGSVLVQLHLVTAGQGADEVVGVGRFCRRDDFLIGGVQSAVPDVLHDGTLEQPGVLQHHAEALAQCAAVEVADVVAAQGDGTRIHIVEPHQQLDHGGLTGTGRADDGDLFARFDLTAEIVDDGLIGGVAELDVVEGHLTVDVRSIRTVCRVGLLVFLRLVQELEHALCGRCHALQHVGHLCELLDGLGEVLDILDERLNIADGDGAVGGKDAADDGDRYIAEVAHKVHDGHHQAGKELALPRGFIQLVVGGVEVGEDIGLPVERLDDVVAGVDLLDLTVHDAQCCLLCLKILLAELDDQHHQCQRDRQDEQGDQGHFGADGEHHDEDAHHRGDAGNELGDALVQALAEGVDIVGDTGKHFADGALFKVGEGQAVDLFADLLAEIVADLLREVRHQPALQEAERRRAEVHRE